MRLHNFPLRRMILFLLLLLVAGQLTSLGHARTAMREAERWKNEYPTPSSMGYFPRISPSAEHDEEEEEFSSVYGVSKRLVPQGPNPLHN
ncbi:hypothetical protein MUK42_21237 [Musa troglodytarum]|uniref:Uncharacterized protein n=1 Tax=Musa troglodytarum TaxID=320322 RepID=A0A9E7K6B8_9LILI|nr:hypothetical protein MUK42_21237 [Musa troglodytarum]